MGMLDEKDLELIGVEVGKVLRLKIMPKLDLIIEDLRAIKGELKETRTLLIRKSTMADGS
jgi:hypothetical protein